MEKAEKTCSVEGCEGKIKAKMLCEKHYARQRRNGSPTALKNIGYGVEMLCSIEGCNGEHYSKGLCKHHYRSEYEYPKRKFKRLIKGKSLLELFGEQPSKK